MQTLCKTGLSNKLTKHLVHVLGARPQHGANQEDYEEDGGRVINLWIYKTSEMMLGSLVGWQPNDLDFMLIEAMEAWDARGRLWAANTKCLG